MEACSIEITLDGGLTHSQVRDEFNRLRDEASETNNGEEPHTGDWDSIQYIKFSSETYDDYYEAHYALSKLVQKGEAVAAKFIDASNDHMWLVFGWAPE